MYDEDIIREKLKIGMDLESAKNCAWIEED